MVMDAYQLGEHAFQLGEIAEALIKMEGMKAENEFRKIKGESPAYVMEHFEDLIDEHGLHHNSRCKKMQEFYP